MLRKQYVLVSSTDRVRGSSTSDFVVKPPVLRNVVNSAARMIVIENGIYNVDETNNTFRINSIQVSLDAGYYDLAGLASGLANAFTTQGLTVQVDVLANQRIRLQTADCPHSVLKQRQQRQ